MKKLLSILFFLCNVQILVSSQQNQNLIAALELASQLPQSTSSSFLDTMKGLWSSITGPSQQSTSSAFANKVKGLWNLGAYGDAQGRVTEFITDINQLMQMRPDLEFGLPGIPSLSKLRPTDPLLGQIKYAPFTDDTHMSLYVAHALLQAKNQSISIFLDHLVNNFLNWRNADQQYRAPGINSMNQTVTLQNLKNHGKTNVNLWSRGLLSSINIDKSNDGLRKELWNSEGGCGAVMRVAPTSIMFKDNPALAEQAAVAQGILTHTNSGSRAACAGFNAALLAIFHNKPLPDIWNAAITAAQKYDTRNYSQPYDPQTYHYGTNHFSKNGCAAMCQQALKYANDSKKPYREVLDEFRGWGATESLAATLYIFATWNHDPYFAMTVAINRTPGDSDSIAEMVGQLLGAQYGYDGIVENFKKHDMNFDTELGYLENINNLKEYPKDFPKFVELDIKTFNDLARVMSK